MNHMTKLVCISDTHCQLSKVTLPEGDILVHAGDALSGGTHSELMQFLSEMEELVDNYKYVIYVPGNHDRITEINEALVKEECENRGIIYLNDSGIELEGIKFWGSAVTPRFHDWAWNRDSRNSGTSVSESHPSHNSIEPHWKLLPEDTDVLITHGPPKGILDISVYSGEQCGCEHLFHKVMEVEPKYHIFGHIHYYGGQTVKVGDTTFVNASTCTEQYNPTNSPVVVDI